MIQIKDSLPENKEKKFLSYDFKQFFLIEFTKQLILNSAPMELLKLKEILDEEKEEKKFRAKKEIEKLTKNVAEVIETPSDKNLLENIEKQWAKPKIKRRSYPFEELKNPRLTIPEPELPAYLRYLKPLPTNYEIDLGKLNPLIKDPFVKSVECFGPDSNIVVRGNMGEKQTKIVLGKNEIDEIIQKFSNESKIPVQEGIYKVVVGKLIFMAIVSEVIGSKFIINKMFYQRNNLIPMRR